MRIRFVLALAISFFFAVGNRGLLAAGAGAPDVNPEGDTGALKAQIQTGGSYDIQSGNGTRIVNDLHVPGALGAYGLDFTRYWNSLHPEDTNEDAEWPMDFADSGWSHSWRWSAIYGEQLPDFESGGALQTYITSISIAFPDGHVTKFKIARTNGSTGGGVVDPRCGPPYSNPGETDWPNLAGHVHDHLVSMALDGHEFWLSRADGGSVHFFGVAYDFIEGHKRWFYQATEVFDPNGFRTDLIYNQNGNLREVRQEGGRYLTIHWGGVGYGAVITSVDSGSDYGLQSQPVSYGYSTLAPGLDVLTSVTYPDEPAPGQTSSAYYTYDMQWGDDPNTADQEPNGFPLLKIALDPHFAGAMTKISYKYWGKACHTHPPHNCGAPCANWFYFRPETVIAERSRDHYTTVVSSFNPECEKGSRYEANGIGGWRRFYFGPGEGTSPFGYELVSETDFYQTAYPQNPIRRRQTGSEPGSVWDGRGILTNLAHADGHLSQVHNIDGSNSFFDWITPGNSAAPDYPARIHNQRHHWLFKKTDELGRSTIYTRDARRRVSQIDYPDGSYETYTYDNGQANGLNQVTGHRLPSGAIETFEYDGAHRLVRKYNSFDIGNNPLDYIEYTYDSLERVATMKDGLARERGAPFTTRMTYNGRHQALSVEYAAVGGQSIPMVRYEYNFYGNCTAIVDELGHRKDYLYDDYRRCTSFTEQVNGPGPNGTNVASRRWDWIYDRVVDGVATTLRASAHTSKDWRVQIEPEFNANHDRRVTARTFDFNNRITSEQTGVIQPAGAIGPSNPWHNGPDTELHRFTYDENGQKSSYTDPLGRITTYGYDNRNRLETTTEPKRTSQPTNPVTRFAYDVAGNKKVVTFPDNKTQQWDDYDAFGQAWKFTDERHNVTDLIYCWGPMKKLYKVTTHRLKDSGSMEHQLTTFSYDPPGRSTQTLFPDGTDEFSNYRFGQLSTWKTRRNQTKLVHYDVRGREDSHTWENGTAPGINRIWDPANRLTSITNAFSSVDYTYDDASQAMTEGSTVTGSGGRRQLIYWRYPSGEVSRLTYPDGSTVNRGYTARGQLEGVDWNNGTMSTSYAYLADGKVNYQARTNGVTTTYGYDGRGIISSLSHTAGGHDQAKRDYWRDDRDRIRAWKRGTDTAWNQMETGTGNRYGYDDEGQLTAASYRAATPEGTPNGALRTDSFTYDELGNRTGANRVASRGLVNFTRRDNGLNQYLNWTPSAIYYDDNFGSPYVSPGNGVMMAEGYITASFNALNQPMAIWSPAYGSNFLWFGFDPLGRCVKRWVGTVTGVPVGSNSTTYYYYDGWNMVQEGPNATTADHSYVHGGRVDEIVASKVGGLWYNHHYDGQGNCIMLTAGLPPGAIQEQYDYDAFGFPYFYTASGGTLSSIPRTRFLFTGREWLSDLRIYDYRARQYQPELGRFLQPDPQEFAAGDYNLYRYCHNDPVNKSDPFGLETKAYEGAVTPWSANFNPPDRTVLVAHGNLTNGAVTVVNGKTTGVITASTLAKDAIKLGFSESKNKVDLSICESGAGGKNSLAQKVANELAALTGVKPDVSAPDGKTANPASVNNSTGKITSGPITATADPAKGQSGEIKHFTAEIKDQKKEK